MEKQIALKQITSLMAQNSLTISEVMEQIKPSSRKFDLLCIIDGNPIRLPFEEGQHYNPIGIFPIEGYDYYLFLDETHEMQRRYADERRLPPDAFWNKIFPIRKQLNSYLTTLNKPVLNGNYFAKGNFNWIITINDSSHVCPECDFYEDGVPAKIRYCGEFIT